MEDVFLGQLIKKLREEKHLTQQELSRRSGIDREYISQLEHGKTKSITLRTARALAKGLDVNPATFFTGEYLETPEKLIERLKLTLPKRIPIYDHWQYQINKAEQPAEYRYYDDNNLEGYHIQGLELEPYLLNGDIVIVNRKIKINNNDMVICHIKGKGYIGRLKNQDNQCRIETLRGSFKCEDCTNMVRVVEIIRRLSY